jgi:ATP-GRASP peptide maturase of grasp-with-spasm system
MSEELDLSTTHICEWLLHWKVPFFRINLEDTIEVEKIYLRNRTNWDIILCKNKKDILSIRSVRAYWYRRGAICLNFPDVMLSSNGMLEKYIKTYFNEEKKVITDFIHFHLRNIPHIGTFHKGGVNKLELLQMAVELDILIPETLITTNIEKVQKEMVSQKWITKSISECFSPKVENLGFMTYTEEVSVESISDEFAPSLFQEKIDKEADIRIFYLLGEFYSMAICSQQNPQTATDFRKYDNVNPNKSFPFNLPELLKNKLDLLMKTAGLQTASIDMVLTKDDRFVFLEANPVGQFHMTSIPCNYNLEKKLALQLKKMNYE